MLTLWRIKSLFLSPKPKFFFLLKLLNEVVARQFLHSLMRCQPVWHPSVRYAPKFAFQWQWFMGEILSAAGFLKVHCLLPAFWFCDEPLSFVLLHCYPGWIVEWCYRCSHFWLMTCVYTECLLPKQLFYCSWLEGRPTLWFSFFSSLKCTHFFTRVFYPALLFNPLNLIHCSHIFNDALEMNTLVDVSCVKTWLFTSAFCQHTFLPLPAFPVRTRCSDLILRLC